MEKDFYQNIFDVVREIPAGRVTSYGAIAKYLGAARSSRLVGWAMNLSHTQAKDIPAHRVVNRNGLLTGKMHFNSPTEMEDLLKADGVIVKDDKIQNFRSVFWDPEIELA
ncbi:MAG: MGMT family protein [Crocinitomicaceae bacterium]